MQMSTVIRFPLRLTRLVGSSGLEPPTSRLSGARSNRLSYEPIYFFFSLSGGDEQNRTVDPLLARQVLSQLSYAPSLKSTISIPSRLPIAALFIPRLHPIN